jgi:hypothetical protein
LNQVHEQCRDVGDRLAAARVGTGGMYAEGDAKQGHTPQ